MTSSTINRSRFGFLAPSDDAEEISLEKFPVLLPEFKPIEGETPLRDGEPPTKLGLRFRKAVAEANGIDEGDVPHGLIRDIEALSADHDANIKAFSQSYVTRNHAGEQQIVRIKAHTFLVGPALANGRMMSRVGRKLDGRARVITHAGEEYEKFQLPRLLLDNADQALAVGSAQRQIEDLRAYGVADQNFLDSIALEGIIQAPVVALFHLRTDDGDEGFLTQSEDGWRRLTASREICSELLGVSTDLTYRHWQDRDNGKLTVRSHDAESIRRTLSLLRFNSSQKAGLLYPSSKSVASVRNWLRDVVADNALVRAFHRLRTVDIELVIAMRPRPGKTAFDVFYLDMAGRHVPGRAPKEWNEADVRGVVAVKAIDELVEADKVTRGKRAVWLGEKAAPTGDDPEAEPFRNRIVAGLDLLATLTTNGDEERQAIVRGELRDHGRPNSPTEAATIAAAQAAVVFVVDGTAAMGQVSAAMSSTFKHASLYKTNAHKGSWPDLIRSNPESLHAEAVAEIGGEFGHPDRLVGDLGPCQRALMAMTAVAHMTNPALIERDHQMTRTGRGGRNVSGQNVTADPPTLLQAMVRDIDGLRRCLAIIEAACLPLPIVPLDPITEGEELELTEEFLRQEYLGTASTSSVPKDDPDKLDAESRWWNDLDQLRVAAENVRNTAGTLRERPVPADLAGADEHDDYDEDEAEKMLDRYGVKPHDADAIKVSLNDVVDFVNTGRAIHTMLRRS